MLTSIQDLTQAVNTNLTNSVKALASVYASTSALRASSGVYIVVPLYTSVIRDSIAKTIKDIAKTVSLECNGGLDVEMDLAEFVTMRESKNSSQSEKIINNALSMLVSKNNVECASDVVETIIKHYPFDALLSEIETQADGLKAKGMAIIAKNISDPLIYKEYSINAKCVAFKYPLGQNQTSYSAYAKSFVNLQKNLAYIEAETNIKFGDSFSHLALILDDVAYEDFCPSGITIGGDHLKFKTAKSSVRIMFSHEAFQAILSFIMVHSANEHTIYMCQKLISQLFTKEAA
jgi:hypothetical protein